MTAMGFLSGKKEVDLEHSILEIRGALNALTLRIRNIEARIAQEAESARVAAARGDRGLARTHLRIAIDLEDRLSKYQQQMLTLESSLFSIEEARDQASVMRAMTAANEALEEVRGALDPTEIQVQLDRLAESLEHVSIARDLLSEDVSSSASPVDTEQRVEQRMASIEAELTLERAGVLPPLESLTGPEAEGNDIDSRIEDILLRLEEEARAEREHGVSS